MQVQHMFTLKMLGIKILLDFFFGMLRLLQHICSCSVQLCNIFFIPSRPGLWILEAGQGTNVYFRWSRFTVTARGYRIATLLLKLAHSCCFSNWCDGQIDREHLLSTHKHTHSPRAQQEVQSYHHCRCGTHNSSTLPHTGVHVPTHSKKSVSCKVGTVI